MKKKNKIIIGVISFIIVGALVGAGAFYFYMDNILHSSSDSIVKVDNSKLFKTEEQKEEAKYIEEKGITNILLLGVDARTKGEPCRTDSIILASIDSNTKKVKLTSFMRDLYVHIPDHGDNRINSAFNKGGAELLMRTINDDFDLGVQYFISIDFKAFQSLVDQMGGIDVNVKQYELKQLNYYIKSANWHNPVYVNKSGYQHLNGQQALSYCRIRKCGNNDYERTERQRKVLSMLVAKARKSSLTKMPGLFSSILPYVKTNIPTVKLMNLGYTAYKIGNTPIETVRVPADGMYASQKVNGMDVLVPDVQKNADFVRNFIFSGISGISKNALVYDQNAFEKEKTASTTGVDKNNVQASDIQSSNNNKTNTSVSTNSTKKTVTKKKHKKKKKKTNIAETKVSKSKSNNVTQSEASIGIGQADNTDSSNSGTPYDESNNSSNTSNNSSDIN